MESRRSHAGLRSHAGVTVESRSSHAGITVESRCPLEERQEACGSVDGVTMAIRSWETVGHSSLAQAEQKSRVTVGNYSLIIMNRSNNHSVLLFLEPHFNNSHNTSPSPSIIEQIHIPTLHFHFNSSLTLRLRIPTPTHFSATPLPPSTPPFPLQPTPFPLKPHLPIPFQSPHPVKFPITHLTPTPQLQPMSPPPRP